MQQPAITNPLHTTELIKIPFGMNGPRNHALDGGPRNGPIFRRKGAYLDMSGGQYTQATQQRAVLVRCGLRNVAWYCGGQGTVCCVCYVTLHQGQWIHTLTTFFYITCSTESNNLSTDWQYFGVCYTVHDYMFAQKVAVIRNCSEEQLGEMRSTSWDGLRSNVGYGFICCHRKCLPKNN